MHPAPALCVQKRALLPPKATLIMGMGFWTLLLPISVAFPSCTNNGRILLANPLQSSSSTFFLGKFPRLFCLQRRRVGYTNCGTFEFANSIRAFSEPSHILSDKYLRHKGLFRTVGSCLNAPAGPLWGLGC